MITGEYSTGMIRATFTAVPKRLPVLWAKIAVFAAVTFVLMLPSVADRVLREPGDPLASTTSCRSRSRTRAWPGRWSAARATSSLVGIFALALGAIIRNTAGGIAAFAGDLLRDPAADEHPPGELEQRDLPVPARARRAPRCSRSTPAPTTSTPGRASLLFLGYTALAVAIAAVLLVRRDT